MTFKSSFRKSFAYTWYLYVLAVIIPIVVFPLTFSFAHRPQQYEKLSLFLSVDLNGNELESSLEERFKYLNIKDFEVIGQNPETNKLLYLQKLTNIAVNRCDVLVVPESYIESIDFLGSAVEINENIKTKCAVTDETLYKVESFSYAIKLGQNSPLAEYLSVGEDSYAFFGGSSYNVGQYSTKSPTTENAFSLMKYIIGK